MTGNAENGDANVSSRFQLQSPSSGHFGNLDSSQRAAFDEFKKQVEERFGKIEDENIWFDEIAVLRFLRARKFDTDKAMQQLSDTDKWRKEIDLERKFHQVEPEELFRIKRIYPRFLGRRDKVGKFIFVYRPGSLTGSRQEEVFAGKDDTERYDRIAILTESLNRLFIPMQTYLLEKEFPPTEEERKNKIRTLSDVTSIVDFDGMGLSMFWTLRKHLQQASVLNSAHYPETLGSLAIVNAPVFMSTIWTFIQRWFDPVTRAKMFIVTSQQLKQGKLIELINEEDLPKIYGGKLDWKYEDEPALDDDIIKILKSLGGNKLEMPKGPAEWKNDSILIFNEEERNQFTK